MKIKAFAVLNDRKVIRSEQNSIAAASEFIASTARTGIGGGIRVAGMLVLHDDGSRTVHLYVGGESVLRAATLSA